MPGYKVSRLERKQFQNNRYDASFLTDELMVIEDESTVEFANYGDVIAIIHKDQIPELIAWLQAINTKI